MKSISKSSTADLCRICRNTGLARKDGVEGGPPAEGLSVPVYLRDFKPCPFCKHGEAEKSTYRALETEWAKPITQNPARGSNS